MFEYFVTGSLHSDLLFFNVSGVSDDEEILSAELHLYRHRQRVKSSFKGSAMKPVIYMVMAHCKASISPSIPPTLRLTKEISGATGADLPGDGPAVDIAPGKESAAGHHLRGRGRLQLGDLPHPTGCG